ncbi:RNA polymerase sigma-70 factor [Mucilaginibacter rubeus]|uniref:RNA polymerase sigma-70 factor n=1 Tax=Mucilaginibacter rubeus TaxID=2027860 RepID=A0A5C1HVN4_9SPHI|nr:RNA polymerase sigma-70 factor [Mucilaginibacter rubeus]QEM09140.1 RNA polymerase sigma-70 factor [Mucilaginibacter rubeus]
MIRYSKISDTQLLGLLDKSDHSAYTEIYQRYFKLIFRHAFKKLRDEEVARDVVQDVFAGLWLKRSSCAVEANLAGYLYMAVRNRIFNFWAHEKVESAYWASLVDDVGMERFADAPTDHRIRERQLMDYIELQVQELPPKMRRIFELSRKEYLSHKEIAERLDTSEGNVSKQVGNALRILRAKLGAVIYLLLLVFVGVMMLAAWQLRVSLLAAVQVVFTFSGRAV